MFGTGAANIMRGNGDRVFGCIFNDDYHFHCLQTLAVRLTKSVDMQTMIEE
jgi:hypothetical protein